MPGKKILVADDSLTIQKVIRLALSNEGYDIQAVSDGNDAVQQITLIRPHIVLIDVSLPGKSAFEVKREINEMGDLEEVRFILMSSAFEKVDEAQANEVNFHGRLTKPFDPAHLRQILCDVLAQVAAKRMEKTSILPKNSLGSSGPPPIPAHNPPHSDLPPPPPSFDAFPASSHEGTGETSLPPPPIPQSFPEPFFDESDEWDKSHVTPDELPPLPPLEKESVAELWEPDQDFSQKEPSLPPNPMPPPPPLPNSTGENEEDIRELTESTMKISGLEDYQWNVSEPPLKAPQLPPTPPLPPSSPSPQFAIEPPLDKFPEDMPEFYPEHAELGHGDISDHLVPPPEDHHSFTPDFHASPEHPTPELPPLPTPPSLEKENSNLPAEPASPALSAEMIEKMVREQVEASMKGLIQKQLPEIAERLIKQEIHRLLSES